MLMTTYPPPPAQLVGEANLGGAKLAGTAGGEANLGGAKLAGTEGRANCRGGGEVGTGG